MAGDGWSQTARVVDRNVSFSAIPVTTPHVPLRLGISGRGQECMVKKKKKCVLRCRGGCKCGKEMKRKLKEEEAEEEEVKEEKVD